MIEMPPLQFAQVNGIRMGYYEAGPEVRQAAAHPVPRLAGNRVFLASPDQGLERGRHPGDCAGPARLWRDRPARAGRGLRHGASDRRPRRPARPSQDRQGDLRRPRLGRLRRLADAAAPSSIASPASSASTRRITTACRPIRSSCSASASATACISCSFRIPPASRTRSSAAASSRPSTPSCASRCRAQGHAGGAVGRRRRRLGQDQSGLSADDRRLRRQIRSAHADPVAGGKEGVRRYFHEDRLHRRHQLVPQFFAQLAALGRARPSRCACRR